MKLSNSAKILIGVAIFIVLAIGGYYAYTSNSVPIATEPPPEEGPAGQDILDLVTQLDAVQIDPSLFSNALFSNLKDVDVQITPEIAGRGNPFDPIGLETNSVPTQTVTKVLTQ